jgi:ornithine carbamoyltransferase
MTPNLHHRRLWSLDELSRGDVLALLAAAEGLKRAANSGDTHRLLRGKNLALLCEAQAGDRCDAFNQAATDLGAQVARIRPSELQLTQRAAVQETARVLGRLYDAIECEGMPQDLLEVVERDAGVPVYNGLCSDAHPTRVLAVLLTMQQRSAKPLAKMTVCYIGDPRTPDGDALVQAAALLGMDLRVVAPRTQAPLPERLLRARGLAHGSGARLNFSKSRAAAAADADFVLDGAASADAERERNQQFVLQALLISTIS